MFGISYWVLPLFAGATWLGTLLGMLLYWVCNGKPMYPWNDNGQTIPYISDIGASFLQPLFIAGSATMVVVFNAAFVSERWLRHKNRLTPTYSKAEAALSVCAIIAAMIGGLGLILLTIFDVKTYPHVHDSLLVVFIAGYIVSAIFIDAEYQRLGIHYREYRVLRASFWIKLGFIFVELGLVIGFGVESYQGHPNNAAYLEWIVSLIYIFYVWSFILDFLPALHTKPHENRFAPIKKGHDPRASDTEAFGNVSGGPVYTSGGQDMRESGREYRS